MENQRIKSQIISFNAIVKKLFFGELAFKQCIFRKQKHKCTLLTTNEGEKEEPKNIIGVSFDQQPK